jgi:hypothetical protein
MSQLPSQLVHAAAIQQAHPLYCQLTGQTLRLAFHRERSWYELLGAGYSLEDLRAVITYLQREIRAQRRNVGALKLSNLLQPDRFEEVSKSAGSVCAHSHLHPLRSLRLRLPH